MNTVIPSCFKSFKCTNKNCSDNCCIGWEIDVDEETLNFYKSYSGKLSEKLVSSVSDTSPCHFLMRKNGRCPFLREDNLCEIIIELGEDKIPYICKNHPRFYEWLYDRTEMGIGLACEEGARLLFEKDSSFSLNLSYNLTDNLSDILTYARETLFFIIKNSPFSFCDRLFILTDFAYELDYLLFEGRENEIKSLSDTYKDFDFLNTKKEENNYKKTFDIYSFFNVFKKLNPIGNYWDEYLSSLSKNADGILKNLNAFLEFYKEKIYEYENLLLYYFYRYFLKSTYDNDVLSKVKFSVISVIFNILADTLSFIKEGDSMRIRNAVIYSKEIEYSEENLEILFEEAIENPLFSYENMASFFNLFN